MAPTVYLLPVLVSFQFFHWFDPSQTYLTKYVNDHYNITITEMENNIFAFDIPFQIASALFIALLYLSFSERVALLACASASVLSPILILFSSSSTGVLISQLTWSLGFCAIFLVTAVLFTHLPRRLYLKAAGYSSVAMMTASCVSDFIGFGLAMSKVHHSIEFTFYLAAASSTVGLFIIVVGSITNTIPSHSNRLRHSAAAETQAATTTAEVSVSPAVDEVDMNVSLRSLGLTALRHSRLILWLLTYAIMRAIHTVAISLWSLLVLERDHAHVRYNGLVGAMTYIVASLGVLSLEHLPSLAKYIARLHQRQAYPFVVMILLVCGGLMIALAHCHSILAVGTCLVLYHLFAEAFFVVAATYMAKHLQQIMLNVFLGNKPQLGSTGAGDEAHVLKSDIVADRFLLLLQSQHAQRLYHTLYLLLMTTRFSLGLVIQAVFQIIIWPRWGSLRNIFGLDLDVSAQLQAYGFALVACSALAFAIAVHVYRRQSASSHTLEEQSPLLN
eukprot:m.28191 g.28191  ORF g.28191 m.28191 type:complete len:502 (+) comp10402_c0_seq1:549-2054(+)